MRPTSLILLVLFLDVVVISCFLAAEAIRFGLRSVVVRGERELHRLPADRYHGQLQGVVDVFLSVVMSVGVALLLDRQQSTFEWVNGLVLVIVPAAMLLSFRFRGATGRYARPVARARPRRVLALVDEDLAGVTTVPAAASQRLRARLVRVRRLGDRLVTTASTRRWRDAARQDARWLMAGATISAALPLPVLAWAVVRLATGRAGAEAVPGVALLAAMVVAVALALLLRFHRSRRDLRDLGVELATESRRLLVRLDGLPTVDADDPGPVSPEPSVGEALGLAWRTLRRAGVRLATTSRRD